MGFLAAAYLLDAADDASPYADTPASAEMRTEHFQFRYLPADRAGALALSAIADEGLEALQQLLGVERSRLIVADLTETSSEHFGIAGWQKVRIERGVLDDPVMRRHVLYHEAVHVLATALSDRRLAEHGAYAHFFSEGLAEWAAHRLHDMSNAREALLDQAAAAWQRHNLRFDDLMNAGGFLAQYDEWLVYAVGYAWVDALVSACGEQQPGNALRAMARPQAPRTFSGRRFWRDTLQISGCDLAAVNARFAELLGTRELDPQRLPVVDGGLFDASESLLVFEVSLEPVVPGRSFDVAVRVRDEARAGRAGTMTRYATIDDGKPALVYVPTSAVSGVRFQYQLGVEVDPDEPLLYGRWRSESR